MTNWTTLSQILKTACVCTIILTLCSLGACNAKPKQTDRQTKVENIEKAEGQQDKAEPKLRLYEKLDEMSARWQIDAEELAFDFGHKEANKYLEDLNSPWAEPEFISAELAQKEGLDWAENRWVRWLKGTSATLHFYYLPTEDVQTYTLSLGLRPKVNDSMHIMFYRYDEEKDGMAWTDAQTVPLKAGWATYKVDIPKEKLDPSGMQLLRIRFPNAYYEGDERVSAKFVRLSFAPQSHKDEHAVDDIQALPLGLKQTSSTVLGQERQAWGLLEGRQMQHFLIPPTNAKLSFELAPGPWLTENERFVVEVASDEDGNKVVADILLEPGTTWKQHLIDLESYAQTGIRLRMGLLEKADDDIFLPPIGKHRPKALLANPKILQIQNDKNKQIAKELKAKTKRIVILAIDNLRADRLFLTEKRRATAGLSALFDRSTHGLAMAESLSHIATAVSFLSTQPSQVHQVDDWISHLRTSQTTIAEAGRELGWKSHYFVDSSALSPTRGLAQGFETRQVIDFDGSGNKSQKTLKIVQNSLSQAPEKSLYFVHLSELRLPYTSDDETLRKWGKPNYNGPITPTAMQNVTVLSKPNTDDIAQFEAYYDGAVNKVDAAVSQFADHLPSDCLLLVFATHASSVAEATLGYEQTLSPWESILPFFFYHPKSQTRHSLEGITTMSELSATILDIMGANLPANAHSVFERFPSRPRAQYKNSLATTSSDAFYRMRREGVDIILPWSLENLEQEAYDKRRYPILRRALREQLVE